MTEADIIEERLRSALAGADDPRCPPRLRQAVQLAVFAGGGRFRPKLCIAVAKACGAPADAALPGAVAIELMHCASLVHDDLACFDDADTRRGKPAVHRAFGESLAVLVGDSLIVLAFEALAEFGARDHRAVGPAVRLLSAAAALPHGLAAGQAWESEPSPALDRYHEAKTGSLFAGATCLGALAAGRRPDEWHSFGMLIGRCYQAIDDLHDLTGRSDTMGKPAGQDARMDRPNLALALGPRAAAGKARELIGLATGAIPDCRGAEALAQLVATHMNAALAPALAFEAA